MTGAFGDHMNLQRQTKDDYMRRNTGIERGIYNMKNTGDYRWDGLRWECEQGKARVCTGYVQKM